MAASTARLGGLATCCSNPASVERCTSSGSAYAMSRRGTPHLPHLISIAKVLGRSGVLEHDEGIGDGAEARNREGLSDVALDLGGGGGIELVQGHQQGEGQNAHGAWWEHGPFKRLPSAATRDLKARKSLRRSCLPKRSGDVKPRHGNDRGSRPALPRKNHSPTRLDRLWVPAIPDCQWCLKTAGRGLAAGKTEGFRRSQYHSVPDSAAAFVGPAIGADWAVALVVPQECRWHGS
jgi:hypothetical protein